MNLKKNEINIIQSAETKFLRREKEYKNRVQLKMISGIN